MRRFSSNVMSGKLIEGLRNMNLGQESRPPGSVMGVTYFQNSIKSFSDLYSRSQEDEKIQCLKFMAQNMGTKRTALKSSLDRTYKELTLDDSQETSMLGLKLQRSIRPKYSAVIAAIGHTDRGVKFLCDMRADLLKWMRRERVNGEVESLRALESHLKESLSLWFSVGLLQLDRVTWESACDLLEKISLWEAVHPVRSWTDIKQRVGAQRRCFVFTHPSMPREPLIALHVALTDHISVSVQDIVKKQERNTSESSSLLPENVEGITTAIFYSITSMQEGLAGIELGNHLIKRVVQELIREVPSIHRFSTLSPIPGFKDWVMDRLKLSRRGQTELLLSSEIRILERSLGVVGKDAVYGALKEELFGNLWIGKTELLPSLKPILLRICASYLFAAKHRGYALNSVANFHFRNGAVLWRINWLGDTSPRGLNNSFGLMVNYRYFLELTEENGQNYIERHKGLHTNWMSSL